LVIVVSSSPGSSDARAAEAIADDLKIERPVHHK